MHKSKLVRNVRLGIKNLMLHALRSLLTVLGLVFGVGSVIAMLSVGEGASQEALDQIRKLGSNNIIISAMKPVLDEQSGQHRTRLAEYGPKHEDARRISETMSTVRRIVPVKLVRKTASLNNHSMDMRVVGTTEGWFELVRRKVVAGRVLSAGDLRTAANVCVLTEFGARDLLATQHAIGQTVDIGGESFTVVGIVISEHGGEQMPDMKADAYIPISAFIERFGEIDTRGESGSFSRTLVELHNIIVEVKSRDQVEPTAAAIKAMFERFHENLDYDIKVPLALLRQAEASKRMFTIVLGSIAGISLLVGGIGIMNIMLASVTERTREIGIRRAIGARKSQIIGQFLIETVVLSTVGGLIGVVVGLIPPVLISYFSDMPTVTPLYSIVLSLGISMGVGIIFGIYPAMRAAALDPIEALRHE